MAGNTKNKGMRNGNAHRHYYQARQSKGWDDVNRKHRQNKHHARHPNDETPISAKYRRRTPQQKGGWMTKHQIKNLGIGNMMNPDEKGRAYGRKGTKHLAQVLSHSRAVARMREYAKNPTNTNPEKGELTGSITQKLKELNEHSLE